jgi:hypothetical protein
MVDRWPLPPDEMDIRREVYRALEQAGADFHVLAIVGSWGDTLDDRDVLEALKAENDGWRADPLAWAQPDEDA